MRNDSEKTLAAIGVLAMAQSGAAQQADITARITAEMPSASFVVNGETIVIERNNDADARLENEFAKTSRACPPFCIHPMSVAPGVETVGELELIAFIDSHLEEGTGLLIDSRIPDWYGKGTIPGAVNIPFTTLAPANPYRDQILQALGARKTGDDWDFSGAFDLLMFCNGPWCDQSPRAIRNLLDVGYPAEKLRYYRGGMQLWLSLGLSTVVN